MIKVYFFVLYVWRQIYNDPDINIANVINSLEDGGGTAMYDGIDIAFNLLQKFIRPSTINKLMVFTDG